MGLWQAIKEYWAASEEVERSKRTVAPGPIVQVAFTREERNSATNEQMRAEGRDNSVYLHSSQWNDLLVPDANGMPPLRFKEHNGRLWFAEDSTGKLVKVANRKLRSLGIWSCKLRGGKYYPDAVKATRIKPFAAAQLVREPDNPHDPHAVAVHTNGGHVGYFNKAMASGLAKRLDAGEVLVAIIASRGTPINVVAASPQIMAHLRRNH